MMHLHIWNYKGVTKRNISSKRLLRASKSNINDEDEGRGQAQQTECCVWA
jgi:hypothetical protein